MHYKGGMRINLHIAVEGCIWVRLKKKVVVWKAVQIGAKTHIEKTQMTYIGGLFIVIDVVDVPGQAKVCDLHHIALGDQHVSGS